MKESISRRRFLEAGLLGGAGAAFFLPAGGFLAKATESTEGICVTLCNHWSYTGIGWQLGIESCVLSATDAMEMADRAPHVKTCLELDALAYKLMAEKFPEVAARLKKYLAADKVEVIGGTYGQPMGTMFSGESNIRQLVYGRETIRKALDYEVATFLDEEEFSHPQIPQIALGAGYRYASLAQVDTWGRTGIPYLEVNAFKWKGMDGSEILSTPKNSLFGYSPNLKQLATSEAFKKLQALGKPLIFTWEEFGWEPPDEPAYLKTPEKYQKFAEESPVEFVTLKDYLDEYGSSAKESIYLKHGRLEQAADLGIGRRPTASHGPQSGRDAVGGGALRCHCRQLGREGQGAVVGAGLETLADLAEPRCRALRILALARGPDGAAGSPRGLPQFHLGRDRLQPSGRRREARPGGVELLPESDSVAPAVPTLRYAASASRGEVRTSPEGRFAIYCRRRVRTRRRRPARFSSIGT